MNDLKDDDDNYGNNDEEGYQPYKEISHAPYPTLKSFPLFPFNSVSGFC